MYKTIRFITIWTFFSCICYSCSFSDSLKEKTYHQEIDSARFVKSIFIGGGGYNIVYKEENRLDTIIVAGYPAMFNDIDTFTVLYKDSLTYSLNIKYLKHENGERYSKTIDLIYW